MITKIIGISSTATTDNRKWDRRQANTNGKKKPTKSANSKNPITFPAHKVFFDA